MALDSSMGGSCSIQPFPSIEFVERLNFNLGNAFEYIWYFHNRAGFYPLKKAHSFLEQQFNSSPMFHLLGEDVFEDLISKIHCCNFSRMQKILLSVILNYASFGKEKYLLSALDILSNWIKIYENLND